MGLEEDFEAAAKEAMTLPPKTTNEDKLILYGLFKQAKEGDCTTSRPGMLDPKGKAKWDAWDKIKGMDKNTAMENYICKVAQLKEAA
mmetsp:Transcript_11685/g.15882  ORF Transcript_11685/g.15882 Transcript_11685/m.15882 type:complete len:87 (-) Transcript_11685:114-374(-)|eukprot:CAMPEP_0196591304 /NCGR_PEP_ID=MMETSP1081-20130531/69102_1 /TAXON_ID=36882 /ORGANISM="Pyramimonas amylifera, Strain CCMP720" /LENGTH=86 /DNA_ID=CAMNT_0041914615 /DNA_START=91 /DNA_END=351 /DNA_ORIENTATION=+